MKQREEIMIDGNRCLVEYNGDDIVVIKVLELNSINSVDVSITIIPDENASIKDTF